jgi:hypothetical protein
MKKLIGMATFAVALATVGCSTTNAEKQYAADTPPPLASNTRADKSATTVIDPVKMPRAKTQVSADEIDDANVMDTVRKLEGEMNAEKRASARAVR